MMKIVSILLLLGAVLASIYYFQYYDGVVVVEENSYLDNDSVTQPKAILKTNNEKKELPSTSNNALPTTEKALPLDEKVEVAERKLQIQKKQTEVEGLMKEFNDNLSNPDSRREIRSKIDHLMAEYNELVLPVALEKLAE